ncbi:MAG: Heme-binding protein A precursor [Candidatus Heimdallarchaeota archaeon LC_2]|nr:MAG: Heme-binding protein A precursor [Candidatus Heimdallarchaeota archaeon LC_2]
MFKIPKNRPCHHRISFLILTIMIITPFVLNSSETEISANASSNIETQSFVNSPNQELNHSVFRISINEYAFNFNDPVDLKFSGTLVRDMIYDPLVRFNSESEEYEPRLAKDWYMTANGRQWTFILQEGVIFHDGTPFNASVVKFNLERILDPSNLGYPEPFPEFGWVVEVQPLIDRVEIINNYEVIIHLTKEFAPFLGSLTNALFISPTNYENGEFVHSYGTGPYVYTSERDTENSTILIRNTNYFRGNPPFEEVQFLHFSNYENEEDFFEAINNHELDFVPQARYDFTTSETLTDDGSWTWKISKEPSAIFFGYINFNHSILSNPLVRIALNHAVDIKSYSKLLPDGMLTEMKSWFGSFLKFYDDEIPGYEFDLETASNLLDEAGYSVDNEGFRFHLNFYVYSQLERFEIFNASLAELGITTSYEVGFNLTKFIEQDFDIGIIGISSESGSDPAGLGEYILREDAQYNWGGYFNPIIGQNLDFAERTTVDHERQFYYSTIQTLLREDSPVVNLFEKKAAYLISTELDKYYGPNGFYFTLSKDEGRDLSLNQQELLSYSMNNVKVYDEAINLWRSDMVIQNLGSERLVVNSNLNYNQSDNGPGKFIKQFSIEVDNPDVKYTLKLYYDEIIDTNLNKSKVIMWDPSTDSWNQISILDQDENLQYIKIQGQGSQNIRIVDTVINLNTTINPDPNLVTTSTDDSNNFQMGLYYILMSFLLAGVVILYTKNNSTLRNEPLKTIKFYALFLTDSKEIIKFVGILTSIILVVVVSFQVYNIDGGIMG